MATARAVGFGENIPEPTLLCLIRSLLSLHMLSLLMAALLCETSVVLGELVLHWDRSETL